MVIRTNSEQEARVASDVGPYEQQSFPGSLDHSSGESLPLERLGKLAVRAWCAGRQLASGLLGPRELLRAAAMAANPGLAEEAAIVASQVAALGTLTEQSHERMLSEIGRFVRRLELVGVDSLSAVTSIHAVDFINEATFQHDRLISPATGTLHLRRSAVRLLFRAARQLHLVTHDPTLDLTLPRRSDLRTRPLTDDEELLGRLASRNTLIATRLRAAWALGQATAVSSELATVTGADVDLASCGVWLHGSGNREPRWGQLTDWGVEQVADRIEALGDRSRPLVYAAKTSAKSGQTSSCEAVRRCSDTPGFTRRPTSGRAPWLLGLAVGSSTRPAGSKALLCSWGCGPWTGRPTSSAGAGRERRHHRHQRAHSGEAGPSQATSRTAAHL